MTGNPAGVAPLRDAATVVLVRDADHGIEVFLQRRVKQMAFAGGMTVFPGGGVDPRDANADLAWTGPDSAWWAEQFTTTAEVAQALVCAAVRETFEECGVLLASDSGGAFVDPTAFSPQRAALVDKSLSLADFLRQQGLSLRADLLRPLAHWITPKFEVRRYDTRFFLAAVPEGQTPDDATSEADVARWAGAQEALDAWADGKHFLLPPTWTQLTEVARCSSVDELLAVPRTITAVEPDAGDGTGLTSLRFAGSDQYMTVLERNETPDVTL